VELAGFAEDLTFDSLEFYPLATQYTPLKLANSLLEELWLQ
jgi:hypothetical protein